MPGQLKIIAGLFKGMSLKSPPEGITRPMRSIMKKSLFDSLGDIVSDATCLDLFAGSGSIGLEAVSRGASVCVFVESHAEVFKVLQKNVDKISNYVDNDQVVLRTVRSTVERFLASGRDPDAPFDLVFLDPPFAARAAAERCLELLDGDRGWLADDGIVVYQCRGKLELENSAWRLIDSRTFGGGTLVKLVRRTD